MRALRGTGARRVAVVLLLGVLAVSRLAVAQQVDPEKLDDVLGKRVDPLTIDDVLARLEDNLRHYDKDVPSFLCDEHVVSQVLPNRMNQDTVTDSVFRLKRTVESNRRVTLSESRDIKRVNGRAAKGDDLAGPSILSGAFSGGLAIVSVDQKACMGYKLRPIRPDRPNDPYVVEFASLPVREHPRDCLLQEEGEGRVVIDPASMQIKRMELTVPHHVLNFSGSTLDGRPIPPVSGVWTVSVDYATVLLGGRSFWMPSVITSNMAAVPGPTVWSFKAQYSNYHKLEVTTRIVIPGEEETAP